MKGTSPFTHIHVDSDETRRYERQVRQLLGDSLREYDAHVAACKKDKNPLLDKWQWKPLKTHEALNVYKERQPTHPEFNRTAKVSAESASGSAHSAIGDKAKKAKATTAVAMAAYTPEAALSASASSVTSSVPFASAAVTGHVDGTLTDVMFGLMATDTAELQLRSHYMTDAESMDAAMICSIQSPSETKPFRSLGLQWAVRGEARFKSSSKGPRDFVFLVASGVVRHQVPGASATQEVGYHLCHSVDLPECGELASQGLVRGWMSTVSLFTQSKENPAHVDVFARGFVDFTGKMPDYQAANMTATLLLGGVAEASSCGQNKKLSWLLNSNGAAVEFRRNQPEANSRSNRCSICDRKFGVLHSVASCSLCQSKMCSRCRVNRDLSFINRSDATLSLTDSRSWDEGHSLNAQVRSLTAVVCKNCIMSSSHLDARVVARREIQGADFSMVGNTIASTGSSKAPEPRRRTSLSSSTHSGSERTFEVFEAGKPAKMKFWAPGGDKTALKSRVCREDNEQDQLSQLKTLESKTSQLEAARLKLQSSMRSSASTVPSPRDHEHEQSFELTPYQQPRHQPQYVAEEPEISYTYNPQHSANSRADLVRRMAELHKTAESVYQFTSKMNAKTRHRHQQQSTAISELD